jgi:hypothetical protein
VAVTNSLALRVIHASPFKLSFTVRSGTTRVRHRIMAEFALARSVPVTWARCPPASRTTCLKPLGRATKIPPRRECVRHLQLILLGYSSSLRSYPHLHSQTVNEIVLEHGHRARASKTGKTERGKEEREREKCLDLFYFFPDRENEARNSIWHRAGRGAGTA